MGMFRFMAYMFTCLQEVHTDGCFLGQSLADFRTKPRLQFLKRDDARLHAVPVTIIHFGISRHQSTSLHLASVEYLLG